MEKTELKSLNKVYKNSLIKSFPHYFYGPVRMLLMSSRSTLGYQIFINDINLFSNEIKNRRNGGANRADHLTSTSRLFEWRIELREKGSAKEWKFMTFHNGNSDANKRNEKIPVTLGVILLFHIICKSISKRLSRKSDLGSSGN